MAGFFNLITSLHSLATALLPLITASAQASSSNSNNTEMGRARAAEEDLKRLMVTLEGIKAPLLAAEERKTRDRSVMLWLEKLKKAAYDAEDVLGEYHYEVLRVQVEAREASSSHKGKQMESIEHIVPIPYGMVDQLNIIRSRFDHLAKDCEALQLKESDRVSLANNKTLRPPTIHMLDEAGIFGRDGKVEEVINFLLYEKEKSFSVISIVGTGGIGKTTIAQLVYKDGRVSGCFDLFGWVCVSQEFNVERLTKAMIESVSKMYSGFTELISLQEKLAEIVKGKTILLVLDDVWNENQSFWQLFLVPFKEAKMVRILMTTRNKKVAAVMQTMACLSPTNLPEDLCWQLFQHYAFGGTSDTVPTHLVDMGRDIMRKCGGLPSVVKLIASFLRHENEENWIDILESDLWKSNASNDIFPRCFSSANLREYLCWQLFQHYALSGTSDIEPTHLVDIGRQIKRKCGGLPLAVKQIGSLLQHETEEKSWREILESGFWESNPLNDDVDYSLLEYLQPHSNLKRLQIFYHSATVQGWMRDPFFLKSIQEVLLQRCIQSLPFGNLHTLRRILLRRCNNIQSLPFGNLHSLRDLTIDECNSIRVLQLEQLSSQLEEFHILECNNLELITGLGDLDMLATLEISFCQALKSLTMDKLQLVESMEAFNESSHEKPCVSWKSTSSLRMLTIENCYLLHVLPDGLIPSEFCYVCVHGCGCPDIIILPSPMGHMVDKARMFGRDAEKMKNIDFLPYEKEKSISVLSIVDKGGLKETTIAQLLPLPTGHMVDKARIFGRDAEKKEVINFLLSEKEKSFSVISIVGKGGLGKTTIAELIYKDMRASRCFDLFGWVCVSEGFDVRRLIKATIESISKTIYGVNELSPLEEELVKIVKEKTILLVLDDVWNENQSLWQLFRVPFREAKMVRILVTTRNKKVAEVMQTTACLSLTNLPEDLCWQLFQHYAFSGTSDTVPTHLVDMGRDIMRKCGGLPLAVKLIASLLRHENEENWINILESDLWKSNPSNDIFPALQISYAHLPTHLQRCFLFCSMYPKDYLLEKKFLIELWISHGYIEFRAKKRITEIGVEYYEELKERSLLDDFSNCISECWELQQRYFLDDCSGQLSEFCKLHDIIHDLARYNSEKEHSLVEINQPLDIQKGNFLLEAHHLYAGGFMGYVNQFLQQNQQNLKGLRTISMDLRGCSGDVEHQYCINNTEAMDLNSKLSEYYEECSGEVTICNLVKFEALVVLELKGYNLTKIPDSISMLKNLVYLGITSPCLKMLPLSISLLYSLQTLILDCFSLEYLPECIGNLGNLQFLYIQSGTIKKLPKSLCSLSNLLRLVIRSDDLEEVPLDLKNLSNLYALTIRSNRVQALPNAIGCLTSLEELNLLSLGGSYDDLPYGKLDYIPHGIVNFPAIKTMAAWLGVRTLNWLKDMKELGGKLSIGGLKNMSNLEDAEHANMRNKCKLETLDLCWDPGYYISPYDVKSELRLSIIPEPCEGRLVGADDVVSFSLLDDVVSFSLLECLQPHPNLKKLLVRWYPSATVPNWMRDPSSFRSIQEVLLECCVNIQSLPFENFHTLKHLTIVACSSIRVLHLEKISSQLEKLQVVSCDHLELITGLGDLDMLAALEIYSCHALKSLMMGGLQLVLSAETLGDFYHERPRTGQQTIASLRRLEIENCSLLHFLPDGLIPPEPCYVCVHGCGCPDLERNLTSAINETSCSSNLWRWR